MDLSRSSKKNNELSIENVRSQGEGFSVYILRTMERGYSVRTSTLFGAKNLEFFEIYGVSAQKKRERVEPAVLTFFGQVSSVAERVKAPFLWRPCEQNHVI